MESVPNVKPGDWLQHEALHGSRSRAKRGEVLIVQETDVVLYLDGELGQQTVKRSEITRWWNIWLPKPDPADVEVPFWVKKGKSFRVKESTAIIHTVKDSWVSYMENCNEYNDQFRLMSYRDFDRIGWKPFERVSVWEWLRRPMV